MGKLINVVTLVIAIIALSIALKAYQQNSEADDPISLNIYGDDGASALDPTPQEVTPEPTVVHSDPQLSFVPPSITSNTSNTIGGSGPGVLGNESYQPKVTQSPFVAKPELTSIRERVAGPPSFDGQPIPEASSGDNTLGAPAVAEVEPNVASELEVGDATAAAVGPEVANRFQPPGAALPSSLTANPRNAVTADNALPPAELPNQTADDVIGPAPETSSVPLPSDLSNSSVTPFQAPPVGGGQFVPPNAPARSGAELKSDTSSDTNDGSIASVPAPVATPFSAPAPNTSSSGSAFVPPSASLNANDSISPEGTDSSTDTSTIDTQVRSPLAAPQDLRLPAPSNATAAASPAEDAAARIADASAGQFAPPTADAAAALAAPDVQLNAKPATPPTFPEPRQLVMQSTDSFWTVSERMYGSGEYYQALFEYNRARRGDQAPIRVGDSVAIPSIIELETRYPTLVPKATQSSANPLGNATTLTSTPATSNAVPSTAPKVEAIPSVDTLRPRATEADENAYSRPAAGPRYLSTPPSSDGSSPAPFGEVGAYGSAQKPTPVAESTPAQLPTEGSRSYEVKAGDNLFIIARNELGDVARWAEILRLNKEALGHNVARLEPGTKLVLPSK